MPNFGCNLCFFQDREDLCTPEIKMRAVLENHCGCAPDVDEEGRDVIIWLDREDREGGA